MEPMYSGNAWKNIVYRIAGEEKRDFVTLAFGWKSVVGKILAEKTQLIKIENEVLFVSVSNNVWMQELILRKEQIRKDILSKLKVNLNEIVFFIGKDEKNSGLHKQEILW
jgi:predicted nucleic acid-binding Zn ribbon protein